MKINNIIERGWPEFDSGLAIPFPTGEYLIKRYGDYQPCICFVLTEENRDITWLEIDPTEYNLDCKTALMIPGDYWVSRNNNICFRPCLDGEYVLIGTEWGGAGEPSRGKDWDGELRMDAEYTHRAQSKNKGMGNNFYVFYKGGNKDGE